MEVFSSMQFRIPRKKLLPVIISIILMGIMVFCTACGTTETTSSEQKGKTKLVFADAGWDSIKFHNEVARFIIEEGYGYETEITPGTTGVTFEGLKRGDIDIYMEIWTDNLSMYPEAVKNGEILEMSVNFGDNRQGFYVPTYVIKGDPERGIKPLAPELKSIADLPKYWEVFRDPEDKSKGRIYGAIPDWEADEIVSQKVENYGLDKTYNLFRPGSSTALATSIVKAIEKGEPWLGYYWEPEWIMGKYDLTYIEEPVFDEEKWENGYVCAFPSIPVTICVNKELPQRVPEIVEFLKNYKTSTALTNEALAYMEENNVEPTVAAQWFLKKNKDLWTAWVPKDVVTKVEKAIQ
jgi:glycine betaine/proline transport system substrate-binding protein